ncbi:MAG TPA: tetratricopeptide repeat protein [Candidatus Acidoferrum sp.]|nr:tetratricopeptide repeat protein [Candidatus Acidoferrum sp.]
MKLRLVNREFVVSFFPTHFAITAVLLALTGGLVTGQSAAPPLPPQDNVTVEGVVRNPVGETVGDALVRLEGKDAAHSAELRTKADGSFRFSLSEPGKYAVKAEKPGMRDRGVNAFAVSAGEKKHVDLILEPLEAGQVNSANSGSRVATMEFDDKPNFTVAGLTDWNNMGMHGSDATVRTSEALAKETLTLKNGGTAKNPELDSKPGTNSPKSGESEELLRATREEVRKMLATKDTADAHRLLGELDERLGDPLEAVREYERAARMDPSERNYFEWGAELLLHKADQPAVEVFTKGSRMHPGSARMLAGLGAALYASGSYEDAAHRLCEASDLNPKDSAPYLFLGEMQKSATALLPCSEEKLARFAREQPGNAWANYYYGIALWKRDRGSGNSAGLQQAETLLEKAAAIDPKFGEAYLQLGILRSGRGKFEQAIEDYKRTMEVSPQLSEPHYRLGLAYRRVREEAKAEQEFRVYEEMEKAETAALENQRRELRQFMIILKDQPGPRTASPR